MDKYPLIRKIYLYLATLIGLIMIIVSGVQLVNLGLKVYIFTQIDRQDSFNQRIVPGAPFTPDKAQTLNEAKSPVQLTPTEQAQIKNWLANYQSWQDQQKTFDPIKVQHERDAATALAIMIIGLPLFLYHWVVIRKEINKGA